jgi:hypothetical protein
LFFTERSLTSCRQIMEGMLKKTAYGFVTDILYYIHSELPHAERSIQEYATIVQQRVLLSLLGCFVIIVARMFRAFLSLFLHVWLKGFGA